MSRFPHPPHIADQWKRDFPGSTAKLIQVTFLFFIISITKDVGYDKECNMKVIVTQFVLLVSCIQTGLHLYFILIMCMCNQHCVHDWFLFVNPFYKYFTLIY